VTTGAPHLTVPTQTIEASAKRRFRRIAPPAWPADRHHSSWQVPLVDQELHRHHSAARCLAEDGAAARSWGSILEGGYRITGETPAQGDATALWGGGRVGHYHPIYR
jgi:hypothetical protein